MNVSLESDEEINGMVRIGDAKDDEGGGRLVLEVFDASGQLRQRMSKGYHCEEERQALLAEARMAMRLAAGISGGRYVKLGPPV